MAWVHSFFSATRRTHSFNVRTSTSNVCIQTDCIPSASQYEPILYHRSIQTAKKIRSVGRCRIAALSIGRFSFNWTLLSLLTDSFLTKRRNPGCALYSHPHPGIPEASCCSSRAPATCSDRCAYSRIGIFPSSLPHRLATLSLVARPRVIHCLSRSVCFIYIHLSAAATSVV